MAESAQELYERAMAGADEEGRLPLGDIPYWDVFPFETDGLRLKPLQPPVDAEPPRAGEGGRECEACAESDERTAPHNEVWRDASWRLLAVPSSGAPLVLMLQPLEHYDFPDLPDELAASMGRLLVAITSAIEGLPHVARAHVSRWGDGGAHAHVFFIARPAGMPQLRGTCMALWDDFLPPVPTAARDADAHAVVSELVRRHGGTAVGTVPPA